MNISSNKRRMKTEARSRQIMILSFSLIAVLMVMMTSIALNQMHSMAQQLHKVVHHHETYISLMSHMRRNARERTRILHTMLGITDPFDFDTAYMLFQETGSKFLENREKLLSMGVSKEEMALLETQRDMSRIAVNEQQRVISLLRTGEREEATHALVDQATPAQDKALAVMDDFIAFQEQKSDNLLAQSSMELDNSRILIISFLVTTSILAFIVAFYVIRHITLAFERIRASEARERLIIDNMLDGLITINTKGIIESCNQKTLSLFGYSLDELIGKNVTTLMPEPYRSHHDEYIKNYLTTGQPKIIGVGNRELVGQRKNGSTFPMELGVSELIHNEEHIFIGNVHDITRRKEAEEALKRSYEELEEKVEQRTKQLTKANRQLEMVIQEKVAAQERLLHLANYDELTSLPNRTLFFERLRNRIVQCRRNKCTFALFYLDLDGFKSVNDTLGHDMGDELLKQVAVRMQECLRESDDIARIGGDEFTVLIQFDPDQSEQVETVASKIIQEVSRTYELSGYQVEIGTSIGISIYPSDADNKEQLIKYADKAMYEVKKKGKNHFIYYRDASDLPES